MRNPNERINYREPDLSPQFLGLEQKPEDGTGTWYGGVSSHSVLGSPTLGVAELWSAVRCQSSCRPLPMLNHPAPFPPLPNPYGCAIAPCGRNTGAAALGSHRPLLWSILCAHQALPEPGHHDQGVSCGTRMCSQNPNWGHTSHQDTYSCQHSPQEKASLRQTIPSSWHPGTLGRWTATTMCGGEELSEHNAAIHHQTGDPEPSSRHRRFHAANGTGTAEERGQTLTQEYC
jgi:hypothetical protein